MRIFHRKRVENLNQNTNEHLEGGDYGIHFPWISIGFLIAGIISEVTDGLLMFNVLGTYASNNNLTPAIISTVTAIICFASMAAIGYQSANKKIKYSTKYLEIFVWLIVGISIAFLRVFKSLEGSKGVFKQDVQSAIAIGVLQLLLYLGSGMMTYSASKQLTNVKLYEYLMAQRAYNRLIDELADKREHISGGIQDLAVYPEYVKRLQKSKNDVLKNVGHYNKSTRVLCEAKMAIVTDPDQMDVMYEDSKVKEIEERGKWASAQS